MPAKYLAVTIAGAVSLGSYEAGAMFEIFDAIRQHNENPETQRLGDFVYVDVITGASAGGMTAAILAQRLLYQRSDFAGPYSNPLYESWVSQINLQKLTDYVEATMPQGDRPAVLSLLSSAHIEGIAKDTLCQVDGAGQVPLRGGIHAAIDPSRGLRLGLALTNINGLNYGFPMFDQSMFQYTDFSDQFLRKLLPTDRAEDVWKEISQAAVGCGAFPFAFRTKTFIRHREEYDPDGTSNLEKWPQGATWYPFTYTDGGALQNQPLGMAKNLVDLNDEHQDQDRRFYLFVSPSPMLGIQKFDLTEGSTNLLKMASRFIDIYRGQAVFRDWIEIEKINVRLRHLEQRVKSLARELESRHEPMDPWNKGIEAILEVPHSDGTKRHKAHQKLMTRYAEEIHRLGGVESAKGRALLKSALALEETAGLSEYDPMRVYGLVTTAGQLAGAGIWAFVGFMNVKFRDHDYDRGRQIAQSLLTNPNFHVAGELGPLRYQASSIRPVDGTLDGIHLRDIDKKDVKVLKDGFKRRSHEIIDETVPWWCRGPVKWGVARLLDLLIFWEFSRNCQGE